LGLAVAGRGRGDAGLPVELKILVYSWVKNQRGTVWVLPLNNVINKAGHHIG
jgi:hypothetical protein